MWSKYFTLLCLVLLAGRREGAFLSPTLPDILFKWGSYKTDIYPSSKYFNRKFLILNPFAHRHVSAAYPKLKLMTDKLY